MKLNYRQSSGTRAADYTAGVGWNESWPKVERKGNQPAELQFSLVANSPQFVIPVVGRGRAGQDEWQRCVHGVCSGSTTIRVSGWGEQGPVYRTIGGADATKRCVIEKALAEPPPFVGTGRGNRRSGNWRRSLLPGRVSTRRGCRM